MKIIETFRETAIDGETVLMHIGENAIAFGGHFEETFRVNLHGLGSRRQQRIEQCFDWFRNYAPLFARTEFRACWRAFERACSQTSDSTRSAFWRFLDGYQLRSHGKHAIRYVRK
jgi:hypothetical protein